MTPDEFQRAWSNWRTSEDIALLSLWKDGYAKTLAECTAPDAHTLGEHTRRHARGVTVYDRCLLTGSGIRLD